MMLRTAVCLLLAATAFASPGVDIRLSEKELQRYFGVSSHEKAPEYEIVYPEFVTAEGKRSIGRSAIAASFLEVLVDAFGQTLHMELEHDDSNIRPGLEAEYITEEGTIKVPVRTDCLYTGKVVGEPDSLVSVTTCIGLMAVMNHADGPTYIEPLDKEHALKRDIGRGLPHVAYKNAPNSGVRCPVTDDSVYVMESPHAKPDDGPGENYAPEATKYLELGIIGDSELYSFRGSNTHTCLTTLFNAAKNVLQLSSLVGTSLVPKLVRTVVFTSAQAGLKICPDSGQALDRVRKWQFANNLPKSDSKHWDNAAVLTGWELDSGETNGIATRYHGQIVCEIEDAASLTNFRNLLATNVLAHEIGHNLSMSHDGVGNQCSTTGYVMAAGFYASDAKRDPSWSSCSKKYYNDNIGGVSCYDDSN